MAEYPVAFYRAFSETVFGGSMAGIIAQAQNLPAGQMLQIAQEIGAPATGFITAIDEHGVDVRFFSTLTEYPMCGHGTMGLMTWLVEHGWFVPDNGATVTTTLRTPAMASDVEIRIREDGRPEVLLSLAPAVFEPAVLCTDELAGMLGISQEGFRDDLDMKVTITDFRSLLVPIRSVVDLETVTPNFAAITALCHRESIDTIALFTPIAENTGPMIRCREFCPAVGTPEAAASGTTNRAISCYLYLAGQLGDLQNGRLTLRSEQGHEMGRPSVVMSELSTRNGQVVEVRVGGLATKTIEGKFFLP